jgi:replicative DNA helicase
MSTPLDGRYDDDDAWLARDPQAQRAAPQGAASEPDPVAGSAAQHVSVFSDRVIAELELRAKYGDDAAGGESLGFTEIDREMVVEGGQLIVVGAREGVGKTAWGLQVARYIATRTSALTGKGGVVVYYITEMGVQETVERVVATLGQLDARSLKRGVTLDTVAAVRRGFAVLAESGMFIVNAAGWNNEQIAADARAFHRDHPDVRMVFVDNLTGISPTRVRRSEGSHEYIGEIVEGLNMLSMRDKGIGVPVFLFAHLKRRDRMGRSERPTGEDFAGSDKINRWAAILILLHAKDASEGGAPPAPASGFQKSPPAFGPDDMVVVGPDRERWKRSEIGTPDGACSHEFMVVKHRNGRKFITDLDFIGPQMRFVDPKGKTVRPYETPVPETAARADFRAKMRALGDL